MFNVLRSSRLSRSIGSVLCEQTFAVGELIASLGHLEAPVGIQDKKFSLHLGDRTSKLIASWAKKENDNYKISLPALYGHLSDIRHRISSSCPYKIISRHQIVKSIFV